jgi:glycosyltransferase involved in cell wall biosynthesis
MRLLHVATIPSTLEAFFMPFAVHFRKRGWSVDAAAAGITQTSKCAEAFNSCHDIPFSRSPFRNNIPSLSRTIRSLVRDQNYDIVHVHTPNAAFIVRLALRDTRKPKVVYTAHGFHFDKQRPFTIVYWWLEKIAAPWTDKLITVNQEDFQMAKAGLGLDSSRLILIPSAIGIDLDAFKRENFSPAISPTIRKSLNIPNEAIVFLKIAEFIPRKRHSDAIKAFATAGLANAYLLLAGSGPLEESMKTLARQLGIADHVKFLGFRHDVPNLIVASDVVMLVSEREGLPRSIMEAMALETPVIGTKAKGTSELIGNSGITVPVGNVQSIADAIQLTAADPQLRKRNAGEGKAKIREYSLSSVLSAHERIYSDLSGFELNCGTTS